MRDEEEVQRALGTLGKFRVWVTGFSTPSPIDVEAINIEDAIVKAKVVLMMYGISKTLIDKAEYEVGPRDE
jgi:hypothetical protein